MTKGQIVQNRNTINVTLRFQFYSWRMSCLQFLFNLTQSPPLVSRVCGCCVCGLPTNGHRHTCLTFSQDRTEGMWQNKWTCKYYTSFHCRGGAGRGVERVLRAVNGLILPPLHTVPAIILTRSKLGGDNTV